MRPFTEVFGLFPPGEGDVRRVAMTAARAGFAVVAVKPLSKAPMCSLNATERRQVGPDHPCGVHHWTLDAARVDRDFKRLTKDVATAGDGLHLNLGIVPGPSRLIMADADTPETVAALGQWWPGSPNVLTPGVERDGQWVHKDGGHWYWAVPDDVALPSVVTQMKVDGVDFRWGANLQALVPPSVRVEGPYKAQGDIPDVTPAILELIFDRAGTVERRRAKRLEEARFANDTIAEWSVRTLWADLLTPDGWAPTGRLDPSCGCPEYERPGGGSSSRRSALAHEVECRRYENVEGHGPLHVFTTELPAGLAAYHLATGSTTMTKLQYVAWTRHGGNEDAAKVALGLAVDPRDIAEWLTSDGISDDLTPLGVSERQTTKPLVDELASDEGSSGSDGSDDGPSERPKSAAREAYDQLVDKEYTRLMASYEARHKFDELLRRKRGHRDPLTTWLPLDVEGFLAQYEAIGSELAPTMLTRADGTALFYAQRVNGIVGRRGAGKTWLALVTVHQHLDAGGSAVYVDMEDRLSAFRERLMSLGCDVDAYVRSGRLLWMKPDNLPDDLDKVVDAFTARFGLVVFDVMNRLIIRRGGNPDVGNEQVGWLYDNLFDPLSVGGCSVLVLDHPNRRGQRSDATLDDLNPGGGAMKMNNASGHVLGLKVVRQFTRERIAKADSDDKPEITLVSLKDREGYFEEGASVGVMRGDWSIEGPGFGLSIVIDNPGADPTEAETLADIVKDVRKTIVAKLRVAGVMRRGDIRSVVTEGKRWAVEAAVDGLLEANEIEEREGRFYPITTTEGESS